MEISTIPTIGESSRKGIFTERQIIGADDAGEPLLIDLTADALDPRVTFTGPAHFYYTKSGALALCAENEWPLEYQNGQVVGRHAPEPAATNLQPYSRATTISDYLVKSDDLELIVDATGAPDGGAIGKIPIVCESYLVSQDVESAVLVPQTRYALTSGWQRLTYAVTVTRRSRVRLRYGQHGVSTPSIWLTQNPDYGKWLPAGDYAISWFVKAGDGSTFPAGFAQIESGSICTSPVVNETAATASRAASTVTIDTKGFRMITVRYTGNYVESFGALGNVSTLRVAQRTHWGTRYIRQILLSR
ncbi:hypothetical protein [Pantoea septica]|uniref:hypothetical protein n=1 Tax=Pantoea septica TaxID=472695 RepID=UPI0028984B40|nr:hypothetical protein [Pantoea septica]